MAQGPGAVRLGAQATAMNRQGPSSHAPRPGSPQAPTMLLWVGEGREARGC